jgi:hypothetical protein
MYSTNITLQLYLYRVIPADQVDNAVVLCEAIGVKAQLFVSLSVWAAGALNIRNTDCNTT